MGIVLAGIIVAIGYLAVLSTAPSWYRSTLKTAPLVFFALAAGQAGAPAGIVMGLALSALGDLALSRSGARAFLLGLAAFGAAHLAYIGALLGGDLGALALWVGGVLMTLALSTELWLRPHTGDLKWPVRLYVIVICIMMAMASRHPNVLVVFGAAAFVVSDLILAIRAFRLADNHPAARTSDIALWVAYVGGQALICIGFIG